MDNITERERKTRALLCAHAEAYPLLQIEDVFKFLHQSAFGCEHLVKDDSAAAAYIEQEYAALPDGMPPLTERLAGDYCRVHLSWLSEGLTSATLARLFCLSAKKEEDGEAALLRSLTQAQALIAEGDLPFEATAFAQALAAWRAAGFPALRHSELFRAAYHPAYRVLAETYAAYLPLFARIDSLLKKGSAVIAIEGGSASGKTTLAALLRSVYDCNLLHADDFFLRPEQRTAERLAEVGGNFDRERFAEEVVPALSKGSPIRFRPFDCAKRCLSEEITLAPKPLTVVEGVYSTHPALGRYYDLAVFLDISPAYQKERVEKRNSPDLARRFFAEWIPMENAYFERTDILSRCALRFSVAKEQQW